jgi:hypothetical protein
MSFIQREKSSTDSPSRKVVRLNWLRNYFTAAFLTHSSPTHIMAMASYASFSNDLSATVTTIFGDTTDTNTSSTIMPS